MSSARHLAFKNSRPISDQCEGCSQCMDECESEILGMAEQKCKLGKRKWKTSTNENQNNTLVGTTPPNNGHGDIKKSKHKVNKPFMGFHVCPTVWPWGSQLQTWFVFVMCIALVVVFTHAFCLCCSDLSFSKHVLLSAFSHPTLSCMIDYWWVALKMFQARLSTCSLLASSKLKLLCVFFVFLWNCFMSGVFCEFVSGGTSFWNSQTAPQKMVKVFFWGGGVGGKTIFLQSWGFTSSCFWHGPYFLRNMSLKHHEWAFKLQKWSFRTFKIGNLRGWDLWGSKPKGMLTSENRGNALCQDFGLIHKV